MERLGLEVQVIDAPWGAGVDEAKLAEILKADTEKKIKAVAVVHNETTTGNRSSLPMWQPYLMGDASWPLAAHNGLRAPEFGRAACAVLEHYALIRFHWMPVIAMLFAL